jgi:hypothetical protein
MVRRTYVGSTALVHPRSSSRLDKLGDRHPAQGLQAVLVILTIGNVYGSVLGDVSGPLILLFVEMWVDGAFCSVIGVEDPVRAARLAHPGRLVHSSRIATSGSHGHAR